MELPSDAVSEIGHPELNYDRIPKTNVSFLNVLAKRRIDTHIEHPMDSAIVLPKGSRINEERRNEVHSIRS